MARDFDIRYDRTLSDEFLALFEPEGVASGLAEYVKAGLFPLDLRPRRDVKSGAEQMTLYAGLTAVLTVRAMNGLVRLDAHKTHRRNAGFDGAWRTARPAVEWEDAWPEVDLYLERVIPSATESHGRTEGAVQAAVGAYRTHDRLILDREVTPSFRNRSIKKQVLDECRGPILRALAAADLGFGGQPTTLGSECDAVALDANGRVLAVEIKPISAGSIPWVPAQALMYARVLQRWIDEDPVFARRVLERMAAQRQRIGLAPRWDVELADRPVVVPVAAVQRGASAEMVRRMISVRDALRVSTLGGPEIELFEVSLVGKLIPLDQSRLPDGNPKAVTPSYAARENARNAAWKARAATPLPEGARATDGVSYHLPEEYAAHNLLPEVRETVLELFKSERIPWHQSVQGGPSRHLRSSQVQCVNALGQMVRDPARLIAAFGTLLDIDAIRDLGEIDTREKGRFLTFEFNGTKDYLNEGKRLRGAQTTSVDAAFAYRTTDGRDALALVEWKYTETYQSADRNADAKLVERTRRYGDLLVAHDSPVLLDGLEMADLFHEPVYQLVRQQLLAAQIEGDADVSADVVRVVHVLSPSNIAYQRSFVTPGLRDRGDSIDAVWKSLLRTPDRFVKVDPALFCDPAITSDEYVARYGEALS